MQKCRILVVAPYEGLRELVLSMADSLDDITVNVVSGDMECGVESTLDIGFSQYDVIISRGGTATMIKQCVLTPVVSIDISSYDFIRAIALCKGFSGKSAIVGFPSITENAKSLLFTIKESIDVYSINSREELSKLLEELRKNGYRSVIGDVVTTDLSQKMGFNSILLTSGAESLTKAFDEARNICKSIQSYRKHRSALEGMLQEAPYHAALLDADGNILFCDTAISQQLKQTLRNNVDHVLRVGSLQTRNENDKSTSNVLGKRIVVDDHSYAAFYIQDSIITSAASRWFTVSNTQDDIDYPMIALGTYRAHLEQCIHLVSQYNKLNVPITIIGEAGTGKDRLARLIHLTSKNRFSQIITVECDLASEEELHILTNYLLDSIHPGFCPTVFLRKLDKLSFPQQQIMVDLLKTTLLDNFRVIASFQQNPDAIAGEGRLCEALLNYLGPYRIHIPAVRENPEAIPELIIQFLNEANQKLGKQVVTMDNASFELTKSFPWYTNLEQMSRVINDLVLLSDSTQINEEQTRKALKNEAYTSLPVQNCPLDLSKSLNEITLDLIKHILNEENGNLTKTGKRLKISRSTLWRKIHFSDENAADI